MGASTTTYLLDTNIFVSPHRTYYAFDFAQPFWDFLIREAENGKIGTIDEVKNEIVNGEGYLADWFKDNFKIYCDSSQTPAILQAYQTLVQHVNGSMVYNQRAKDEFMNVTNADTWLLAHCLAAQTAHKDVCLVTAEVYSPLSQRRVPIPNICKDFDLEYCTCFDLIRELNFSFK